MKLVINISKRHFNALLILVTILASAGFVIAITSTQAYHPLQDVAKSASDLTSVDANSNGIIDTAEGLKITAGAGTGKVLTSDTGGTGSWQDASTGGGIETGPTRPTCTAARRGTLWFTPRNGEDRLDFCYQVATVTDNIAQSQTGGAAGWINQSLFFGASLRNRSDIAGFTASSSFVLGKVLLHIARPAPPTAYPTNYQVFIQDASGAIVNGGTSSSVPFTNVIAWPPGGWTNFTFPDGAWIEAGKYYTIVLYQTKHPGTVYFNEVASYGNDYKLYSSSTSYAWRRVSLAKFPGQDENLNFVSMDGACAVGMTAAFRDGIYTGAWAAGGDTSCTSYSTGTYSVGGDPVAANAPSPTASDPAPGVDGAPSGPY
ncbi:MAG: hypothetical protein HYU56_04620 [Candidatus Aenigmarchaeota archaeon]|nr:hypothetical protein [Candidatus Aenigmarchaeota archaeon]